MSYLDDGNQWNAFWNAHRDALVGTGDPMTYRNHGLGYTVVARQLYGEPNCYPYYQTPIQADWLANVLDARVGDQTIADSIRQRDLQLRCEPGRSVLDGCGMTVAKVVFRKQHPDGDWFIGLAMNRTQCRTSSDDFLVDPILIPRDNRNDCQAIEGFLVGAYCTESELLSLRKLRFPNGVDVGDLVVFPNTAGYLMHFLESRSHQFPLAKNLAVSNASPLRATLDRIDIPISCGT